MQTRSRRTAAWLVAASWLAALAVAAPSRVERLSDSVLVVRDDDGNWGGSSMGMTHQVSPGYEAKKVLDLSAVPEDFWDAATQVRLSAYFSIRDYSWHDLPKANGLDEAMELVLNGTPHRYATNAGQPVFRERTPMSQCMQWHDFALPRSAFRRGPNEIIFRKLPAKDKKRCDDYLYLGIDNTVPSGRSWVKFDAKGGWTQDKLTIPGGKGEYMVRLYIVRGDTRVQATWQPQQKRRDDPQGLILYAGSHGDATRVEWDPLRFDKLAPIAVVVETDGTAAFDFQWLNDRGEAVAPPIKARGPRFETTLSPPLPIRPSGIQLTKGIPLRAVTLRASRDYHPLPRRVDMAPHIAKPRGAPVPRKPSCRIAAGTVVLANATLRCEFDTSGGKLRLASLYNELAAAEMVRRHAASALFLIEVADKRYAGSRDFECAKVARLRGRRGFVATLTHDGIGLEADLAVWIDDALRMALSVRNFAYEPVDFKVAFPHLSGLAISDTPADDYYFYPMGGGIMSDAPALIRKGYGDHQAIYQVMDIYSPTRGAGLLVRCTDDDGRYKVLALRKHVPGKSEANADRPSCPTADEFKWTNCLPQIPGIGLAYEYLRRTRKPGEAFEPKPVAIEAHPGDWHEAMRRYADWAHRVWKFRPTPSRLTPVINMVAAGWGKSPLYRDGKYRTDFVKRHTDCIELMSWWEWSPLGHWRTPFDKLKDVIGEAKHKRWQPYILPDPMTGQLMLNNQPGDYDGYNRRWGGLPALRQAIRTYREMGALVTLYTDPIRCDDNTKMGQKHGLRWGVVNAKGKYVTNYEVWNMCHDVAEYRQWVADTMGRVMRETGADGIRLDEYGHRGFACFNRMHAHTFAEWGCTEWQRCIAETTKLVREAMDEAKPGSVLTTEHPGYDYLLQFKEGCITYDLTGQASPLRPLECNLQRFHFPECKPYELDHRGADPKHHKRFWNAVASFGRYYPTNMYNILRENADALDSPDTTPLIPTLASRVYANRFRGEGKTFYTLYNATGHTFAGAALRVPVDEGKHLFDMLRCADADWKAAEGGAEVSLFLERDDVACLAVLPARLTAKRTGDIVEVAARQARRNWRLCLCDKDGEPLATAPSPRAASFDLAALPKGSPLPACIKLLAGTRLVDVAAVPAGK